MRELVVELDLKLLYVGMSKEISQYDILTQLCLNKVRINFSVYGRPGVMPENSILAAFTKN